MSFCLQSGRCPLTTPVSRRLRSSAPRALCKMKLPGPLPSLATTRPQPQSPSLLRLLLGAAVGVRTRARSPRGTQRHQARVSPFLPQVLETHDGWADERVDKAPASGVLRTELRCFAAGLFALGLLSFPATASAAQSGDSAWTVRLRRTR
jgi:hypothetical protein